MSFPARAMALLSRRVLSGEVVFFVGAGFSLDSEGNSAKRLIRRLMIRFEAMTRHLAQAQLDGVPDAGAIRRHAIELRRSLRRTFDLPGTADLDPVSTEDNLKILAVSYYTFNDWICSAFTEILADCKRISPGADLKPLRKVWAEILEIERQLLRPGDGAQELDAVDLDEPDLAGLLKLTENDRGKALFLDTMGFANEKIMGGPLLHKPLDMTPRSWTDRVLDRHQVLARLAREGLCPTILTTNYDLLLEWAFRLSGLQPRDVHDPRRLLPPTTFQNLTRISEATEFFGRGSAFRSALIAKIHGCSNTYRDNKGRTPEDWQAYLRSMVFTFREIQNWREDDWSRDFLRTLLRTRTLVFCGYSGMDPVLHDTFRTVYEEMARRRRNDASSDPTPAQRAPAYFLGLAEKNEFHGMEILRAATQAMGAERPELTDHPNYLRFFLGNDEKERFPRLDELMRWLFHLVFRRCQRSALDSDLRRVAAVLLKRPCAESELRTVRSQFLLLFRREMQAARRWDDDNSGCHRQLDRIAGWTDRFQAGLLRELALAESVLRNQGPGIDFEHLRGCPWYFPALERTDWTAWAAVVEIAVRRMVAAWRGASRAWTEDSDWVRPGAGAHPSLLFSAGPEQPTPVELSIRVPAFGRSAEAGSRGVLRGQTLWEIHPQHLPWCMDRRLLTAVAPTPTAKEIWAWSLRGDGEASPQERKKLNLWLGETDERHRASAA